MNISFLEAVKALLNETFDGPEGNGSWYTESKPGSGIFGTLEKISAEEASIPVQGTSIAAHTDHTRYYLWVTNAFMGGEVPERDWTESWKITSVDETTWERYKKELRDEYNQLLEKVNSLESDDKLAESLGSIAHSAYHLGAIRQMVKAIKVPSQT